MIPSRAEAARAWWGGGSCGPLAACSYYMHFKLGGDREICDLDVIIHQLRCNGNEQVESNYVLHEFPQVTHSGAWARINRTNLPPHT